MPKCSKLFLILSIVGVTGLEAVFLMICRNKDEGMPPRKTVAAPVVVLPAEVITLTEAPAAVVEERMEDPAPMVEVPIAESVIEE